MLSETLQQGGLGTACQGVSADPDDTGSFAAILPNLAGLEEEVNAQSWPIGIVPQGGERARPADYV
jgi:hypothetical protein